MAHHWTWDKLVRNSARLNPKSRGNKYPFTPNFEIAKYTSGVNRDKSIIVPYVGTRSCLISLRAWGVTQSGLHTLTLLFSDVDIKLEDPKSNDYFIVYLNNQMYWVKKFSSVRNPLTHRCSCADSYYTFTYYNHKAGCLYGPAPRPYKRKTTTMPPRNPQGLVGCCKHVFNAWKVLQDSGMTLD